MQAVSVSEMTQSIPERPEINKQTLAELQQAFTAFTSMSEELSDSYHVLENRVIELSGELATLSETRLEELNEKERIADQLESLLRLMPASVIVLDRRGFIHQANPAAERLLNEALDEKTSISLVGRPWGQIVKQAFAPKQTDYHEVSLKSGRLVSLETSPLENSGQLVVMTDQTETRALQDKVSRQERLTAMGQMVASLAHQVRTPLSAALLYASNLKSPKLDTSTHDRFVDKLVGRLNHLEKQVQDMLLFVKGECQLVNRLSVTNIFSMLKEATLGLPTEAQAQIKWQIQCVDSYVQCQADALISSFMNVVNNAIEAFDSNAVLNILAKVEGDKLIVRFIDNGPGMQPQQIKKIQEPFFTTKSYGTGLGIPVLIATIKAHKGDVVISSKLGVGTEFKVALPIFQKR